MHCSLHIVAFTSVWLNGNMTSWIEKMKMKKMMKALHL